MNYADYEFSFGTSRGDFLFKRDAEGGMDVLHHRPGDIVLDYVGYFEKSEWSDFCAAFANRYVKGWSPNAPLTDADGNSLTVTLTNTYGESSKELRPESSQESS